MLLSLTTERVQLGVALSAAEKLQALAGPWGAWITELQKKFILAPGALAELLPKLDISRGRPFQILLSYVMIANSSARIVPASGNQTKYLERTDQASALTKAEIILLTRTSRSPSSAARLRWRYPSSSRSVRITMMKRLEPLRRVSPPLVSSVWGGLG